MSTEAHPRGSGSSADGTRTTLTREAVVEAAVARADEEGLDALSFRRLAADLGVTPMALYRYVGSKDELLMAMGELVYGEFPLPDPSGTWQQQLRELAHAYRRLLLRHPAVAEIERKGLPMPSTSGLRVIEVLLGALRTAGFSPQDAAALHERLSRFVVALVLLERAGFRDSSPEEQDRRERELRARLLTLPEDQFAHVVEAADLICRPPDAAESFELALDLMIGGLESLLARR